MIGVGSTSTGNAIFNNNYSYNLLDAEFLNPFLKNIPLFCTLSGILLSVFLIHC